MSHRWLDLRARWLVNLFMVETRETDFHFWSDWIPFEKFELRIVYRLPVTWHKGKMSRETRVASRTADLNLEIESDGFQVSTLKDR